MKTTTGNSKQKTAAAVKKPSQVAQEPKSAKGGAKPVKATVTDLDKMREKRAMFDAVADAASKEKEQTEAAKPEAGVLDPASAEQPVEGVTVSLESAPTEVAAEDEGPAEAPRGTRDVSGPTALNFALRVPKKMDAALRDDAKEAGMRNAEVMRAAVEHYFTMGKSERMKLLKEYGAREVSKAPRQLVVKASKNRVVHTTVQVVDAEHPASKVKPKDGKRWALVCQEHKTTSFRESKGDAIADLQQPWRWCSECLKVLNPEAVLAEKD